MADVAMRTARTRRRSCHLLHRVKSVRRGIAECGSGMKGTRPTAARAMIWYNEKEGPHCCHAEGGVECPSACLLWINPICVLLSLSSSGNKGLFRLCRFADDGAQETRRVTVGTILRIGPLSHEKDERRGSAMTK